MVVYLGGPGETYVQGAAYGQPLPPLFNIIVPALERPFEFFGGTPNGSVTAQAQAVANLTDWWLNQSGKICIFPYMYINMPQIVLITTGVGMRGSSMYGSGIKAKAGLNANFVINYVSADQIEANALFCSIRHMRIDGNKAGQGAGNWRGIFLNTNPGANAQATNDVTFDANHIVEYVYLYNCKGDGIADLGRSASLIANCRTYFCDGIGISPTFDTWMHGNNVGGSGTQGVFCTVPNARLSDHASFYSGNVTPSSGAGIVHQSVNNSGFHMSNVTAQDNKAYGFQLNTVSLTNMAACSADSNSTSSNGTYPAIDLFAAHDCNVELNCQDRKWDGVNSSQLQAIRARTGSINNKVRLTHIAVGTSTVNAPVMQWDSSSTGCEVNIGGYGGQQAIAYATPITPNPTLGGKIMIGTLTGVLTVNPVAVGNRWPGQIITFDFIQDATGRVVTMDAQYHTTAAIPTTPSKEFTVAFEWREDLGFYKELWRSGAV